MSTNSIKKTIPKQQEVDEDFLSDMIDLFVGLNSGHLCKYSYTSNHAAAVWDKIFNTDKEYYIPHADKDLITNALTEVLSCIPTGTTIIDLGPGSIESVKSFALPLLQSLESPSYIPVDINDDFLKTASSIRKSVPQCNVEAHILDFFKPMDRKLHNASALTLLIGGIINNISGDTLSQSPRKHLVDTLSSISNLSDGGWLLVSTDTNNDEKSVREMYGSDLMAEFIPNLFHLMHQALPVENFDPTAFQYEPVWHPSNNLLAHTVVATKTQTFGIGDYRLSISQGKRLHLINSFKFPPDLFESCAIEAGFDVVKRWDHETPMKLYLLKCRSTAAQTAQPDQTRTVAA